MDDEQFEHIPWSRLIDEQGPGWRRVASIATGIVLAVVIGIIGVRWLNGPDHGEAASPATTTVIATTVPDEMSSTAATVATTMVMSEADLIAADPAPGIDIDVRARAEWFVTDFFTVDGDPEAGDEIRQAFVSDAVIPPLPHDETDPGGVSFVEWARAYRIETIEPGRFAVDVAFRTVRLAEDGGYRRGPVHAVEIIVVAAGSEVGIADLPNPIVPPRADGLSGWSAPTDPATDDVLAAAAEYAFLFDAEPEVVEANGAADDWRAVVTIGDGSGIRWPLAVRSTAIEPAD
jgi:hypothetical protein